MKNFKFIIALFVLTVFSVNVWGETIQLTNNTIKGTTGQGTYGNHTIGDFSGKYLISSNSGTYFLQLGYNKDQSKSANNSHLTTPQCSGAITQIQIVTNNSTSSGRTFYLCASEPSGGCASSGDYGSGSTSSTNGTATINVTGSPTQFYIYPDGTAFIASITITYSSGPTKLGTPTGLSASNVTKNSATIEWNKVTNASGYTVSCTGATIGDITVGASKASCQLTGLSKATQYTWKVKATGDGTNYADGDYSSTANFTTLGPTFTDFITECSGNPEISVSPAAIEGLGYVYGSTESAVQTFTVVGSNLSANVTVTAPAGFEVKQEDGNYADKIELTPADGLLNKEVSVRLSTGKTAGNYAGNVTIHSEEITNDKSIALSARVIPVFTVKFVNNGSELTEFEKQVEEGKTLDELPTLTEPCDPHSTTFAGWTTDEAWTEPKTTFTNFVTPTTTVNDNMTLNAVWAEETVVPSEDFTPVTSLDNVENGNYVISYIFNSTTIILKNETSSQTELKAISQSPSSSKYTNPNEAYVWELKKENGNYSVYNASVKKYLNATSSGLTLSETPTYFTLSYSSGFYFTLTNATNYYLSGFISGSNYTFQTTTSSRKLYLYKQGTTIGCKNYITTCSSDPLIEVSRTELTGFSTIATAGPSDAKTFTVEGYNLTNNITVTAPDGYEVSKDNSTYSASVTLNLDGDKVKETILYVRLAAAETPADNVSGNISITSAGATTKNVALTGEVIAAVTVTFKNNDSTTDAPAAIKLGKGGTLGSNLPGVGSMTAPISGYTFVGWVADGDKWNGFTPSLTKSLITGTDPINADVTYDAVWAKGGNDYKLIDENGLKAGNYVFGGYNGGDYKAMGNTLSSNKISGTAVTVTDGVISNPSSALIWTIQENNEQYALYNAAVGKYLNTVSNNANVILQDDPAWFTASYATDDNSNIKWYFESNDRYLEYYQSNFDTESFEYGTINLFRQDISNFFVTTPNEYTVTWHKGNAGETTSAFEGQTFADIVADAPTVADEAAGDCANKFMGWATAAITKDEATESDVQWADNTTPISGDVEYYAVFAYQEGSATNYTLTIGTSDVPTSYTATNKTLTAKDDNDASNTMDVTLQFEGVMLNQNSKIQVRKKDNGTGFIYNTTNLGSVTSISAGDLNTYYGDSEHPTSGSTAGTPYFTIGNTSNTETLSEIVIKYTIGSATYSNYVTQCDLTKATLKFDANGHGTDPENKVVSINEPSSLPTMDNVEGYTFKGWGTTPSTAVAEAMTTFTPTESKTYTFYAVWQKNTHSLTWNPAGGELSGAYTSGQVEYGEAITAPTANKSSYNFSGWTPSVPATMPDNDLSFTATWTATSYTITYNNLKEQTHSNPTFYTIESTTITLTDPSTAIGYTFEGWFDDEIGGTQVTEIAQGSSGNKTLYAHWNTISYDVTYKDATNLTWAQEGNPSEVNIETDKLTANYTVVDGYEVSAMTVTVGDATVDASEIEYDNKKVIISASFSGAVVITPTVTPKNFTLTFHKNVTDDDQTYQQKFSYGEVKNLTPNAFTRTGYTFIGWATTSTSKTKAYDNEASYEFNYPNNKSLYAMWDENPAEWFDITFVDQLQDEDVDPIEHILMGSDITFPILEDRETPPDDTGQCNVAHYHFVGWVLSTELDQLGTTATIHEGGSTASVTANATYYAIWATATIQ